MPESDPNAAGTDKLKEARAQISSLNRELAELRRKADELAAENASLKEQLAAPGRKRSEPQKDLAALAKENQALAIALQEAAATRDVALTAAEKRTKEAAEAVSRAKTAENEAVKLRAEIVQLTRGADELYLADAVSLSDRQVVSADRLGILINDLVNRVDAGVPGLAVNGGRIKLQVALADSDKGAAFVLPTASLSTSNLGALHEFELDFNRAFGAVEKD